VTNKKAALGTGVLFLVNGLVLGSWLPRIPELRDRLGIDLGALGLILAAGSFGSLLGSAVSGLAVRRLGSRVAGIAAALTLLGVLPMLALASDVLVLAGVLASIGFVDSNADVAMNAIGVRVEANVGKSIMTRLHGIWSLGTLMGAAAGALSILAGVDLGTQLIATSLAGATLVLLASPMIPGAPTRSGLGARAGRLALGLMVAGGAAVIIEGIPGDWSAIFLVDVTASTASIAGAGVIVFTAGMLVGRLSGDHVVDRFGSTPTIASGLGLAVASMLMVTISGSTAPALVGFGLWGVGMSVTLPIMYKLAGSHPAFGEGSGLAALTVGTRLGLMVAPAAVGLGASRWGLSTSLVVVVVAASLLSFVALRMTLSLDRDSSDSIPPAVAS
jgi:predicted MFS family arabinose efflux permease